MELNKITENISAMNTPSVGIAGEVRCVITGVDGEVKTDTGYQKNLILNQGLDFFGGGKGAAINASCAIGSGNSAPAVTQTKLDAYIAQASGTDITSDYSYVDKGDGLYRMWEQQKYRFTGLDNVNISEVGLVSTGTSSTTHYLTTRALIKDSLGAPTSISVKTGETLDIYYKIHKVIDTRDKAFVINVLDGDGGSVPYNVVVRPALVGTEAVNEDAFKPLDRKYSSHTSNEDLASIVSEVNTKIFQGSPTLGSYVPSSFKCIIEFSLGLPDSNAQNRTITIGTTMGEFQMRLGRVSDDAPLTKTNKDTLSIPLEFSWGRYEGVL